jgi:hypothetical protein
MLSPDGRDRGGSLFVAPRRRDGGITITKTDKNIYRCLPEKMIPAHASPLPPQSTPGSTAAGNKRRRGSTTRSSSARKLARVALRPSPTNRLEFDREEEEEEKEEEEEEKEPGRWAWPGTDMGRAVLDVCVALLQSSFGLRGEGYTTKKTVTLHVFAPHDERSGRVCLDLAIHLDDAWRPEIDLLHLNRCGTAAGERKGGFLLSVLDRLARAINAESVRLIDQAKVEIAGGRRGGKGGCDVLLSPFLTLAAGDSYYEQFGYDFDGDMEEVDARNAHNAAFRDKPFWATFVKLQPLLRPQAFVTNGTTVQHAEDMARAGAQQSAPAEFAMLEEEDDDEDEEEDEASSSSSRPLDLANATVGQVFAALRNQMQLPHALARWGGGGGCSTAVYQWLTTVMHVFMYADPDHGLQWNHDQEMIKEYRPGNRWEAAIAAMRTSGGSSSSSSSSSSTRRTRRRRMKLLRAPPTMTRRSDLRRTCL